MIDSRLLLVYIAAALIYFGVEEARVGIHKVEQAGKRAGAAIVHALKKIPHPSHTVQSQDEHE